jgi:hypothetical protein
LRPLGLAVALFVGTRLVILFAVDPESWDTGLYYQDARGIAHGEHPYTVERPVEYPPVALWAMRLPFELARHPPSLSQYRHGFRLEMAVCDAAAFALVIAIARRRRPELVAAVAATYAVTTAILANVLYDRLDAGLALLVLGWGYSCLRSRGSLAWTAIAYAVLGLGISFKLVPAVIVPVLAACEVRDSRRFAAALIAGGLLALVPFAVHPGALAVLRIHTVRGIQIESLPASIGSLASLLGADLVVAPSYGSFNLVGRVADVLKIASAIALLGFIAAIAVVAWRRRADAYLLALATLAGATILSNVLSPQYFVWALPATYLLALEVAPERFAVVAIGTIMIAAITAWVFPGHYIGELVPADFPAPLPATVAHLAVAIRNLVDLALVGWLTVRACRGAPRPGECASGSGAETWKVDLPVTPRAASRTASRVSSHLIPIDTDFLDTVSGGYVTPADPVKTWRRPGFMAYQDKEGNLYVGGHV